MKKSERVYLEAYTSLLLVPKETLVSGGVLVLVLPPAFHRECPVQRYGTVQRILLKLPLSPPAVVILRRSFTARR